MIFRLETIFEIASTAQKYISHFKSAQKRHKNNHLTSFTKVKFKSLIHSVACDSDMITTFKNIQVYWAWLAFFKTFLLFRSPRNENPTTTCLKVFVKVFWHWKYLEWALCVYLACLQSLLSHFALRARGKPL